MSVGSVIVNMCRSLQVCTDVCVSMSVSGYVTMCERVYECKCERGCECMCAWAHVSICGRLLLTTEHF